MATSRKFQPSEFNEQVALVRKLRSMGYFVAAVPNGGKRDVREATRMKQEGVVAGVPDLFVLLDGGRIIWIELKTRKGGRVSAVQHVVHEEFESRGQTVIVGRGAKDAFEQFINSLE